MTIEELKNQVGERAKNIITSGLGLESKNNKYRCPNAAAHKHGDKNPSMSWHKEGLQFLCFTCEEKIDIYTYYKKYQGMSHEEIMSMNEDKPKPVFRASGLTEDNLKYLQEIRGLSLETIDHFNLGSSDGNIAIPYTGPDGITGVKIKNMKNTGPKYFSVTGSDFGLFHKAELDTSEPLIITEGEFDCMAVYDAGYKNVASVGTGGGALDKLLKSEKDYLKQFKALIILGDRDEVGQKMTARFLEEFGYQVKLPYPDYYLGCKDANEVLLKHGKDQIKKLVESAEVKIEGLRNLDNTPYKGLESLEGKYIPTGIPSIDYAINDLGPGQVSLITGRSNGGKSTYVNQIIANAIDKGIKVFLIAGEGITEMLINNLYLTAIGKQSGYFVYKTINKRTFKEPKESTLRALKKWHEGKLSLFAKGESNLKTTDELFQIINLEVKLRRPNIIIIDNLMSVLSISKASEKWENQADFIQKCCDIAKAEGVHIIIVLHPSKVVRKNSSMDFEDISGSSDIFNKSDVILSVKRNYDEDRESDGEISVLKNRYFTDLPTVQTFYDSDTGMLLEIGPDGKPISYNLKWERFLNPDEVQPEPVKSYFKMDHTKTFSNKSKKQPSKKASEHKSGELVEIRPGANGGIEMVPAEDKFNPFQGEDEN